MLMPWSSEQGSTVIQSFSVSSLVLHTLRGIIKLPLSSYPGSFPAYMDKRLNYLHLMTLPICDSASS